MKFLFISGIPQNHHGAGNYLAFIKEKLVDKDSKITYLMPSISSKKFNQGVFSHFLTNFPKLFNLVRNLMYFINNLLLVMKCRLFILTHQKVIIFHPQSIGLPLTEFLIRKSKHTYIFVLDNFFICKKSYNNFQNEKIPCFRCSKADKSLEFNCSPFPVVFKDYHYKKLISTFGENLSKTTLLFQNEFQKMIYLDRYPEIKNYEILGMITNEFKEIQKIQPKEYSYDFVFHGTLNKAKGVLIFFEIANKWQNQSFFFPYSKENVKNSLGITDFSPNIVFKSIHWETGYKEIISSAKIIMCLSIWSAPVEGAFLKSIHYNGIICCLNSSFSFYSEIPENIVCKLEVDESNWAIQINKLLNDNIYRESLKNNSQKWLNDYKKLVNKNFECIESKILI